MTGNEMKRRVLVTGANGQLGREMRQVAAGAADEFIFADVVTPEGFETELLDITDAAAVEAFIAERQVDVIVNCAAYTNVDAEHTHYYHHTTGTHSQWLFVVWR